MTKSAASSPFINKPLRVGSEADLQTRNQRWWHQNPMAYDWQETNAAEEGTAEFYREIDKRFFNASPFYAGTTPFEKLIPFSQLAGKRVLEIGCGLGSHAQLLARSGAKFTAIDLTERGIRLTTRRLELQGLSADVRQMDAEKLAFTDSEFDFIWSWGVIHHSEHTDQIMREVARVLKPGGEFRFMVYHRRAFDSYVKLMRGFLTGKLLRSSAADVLSYYTDGYMARFYDKSELTNLIESGGLTADRTMVLGQTSELLPLPGSGAIGRLKYALVDRIPRGFAQYFLSSFGSFIFGCARKPL